MSVPPLKSIKSVACALACSEHLQPQSLESNVPACEVKWTEEGSKVPAWSSAECVRRRTKQQLLLSAEAAGLK